MTYRPQKNQSSTIRETLFGTNAVNMSSRNGLSVAEQSHSLLEEANNREIGALGEQVSLVRLCPPSRRFTDACVARRR